MPCDSPGLSRSKGVLVGASNSHCAGKARESFESSRGNLSGAGDDTHKQGRVGDAIFISFSAPTLGKGAPWLP